MPYLLEPDAYALLSENGIPVPKYRLVRNGEEAERAAAEIGYPVAMKIVSEDILHKSDVGGVKLAVQNGAEARAAFQDLMAAAQKTVPGGRHKGVLVTQMVEGGVETIIGLGMDPEFGPFLMFGLGGIHVEIFKDVSFRLVPLSREHARDMVDEVKSSVLLKGYRGNPPKNLEALIDLIMAVSKMSVANPDIQEMDLNPVIVREEGALAIDARILRQRG